MNRKKKPRSLKRLFKSENASWNNARSRCYGKNHPNRDCYGARRCVKFNYKYAEEVRRIYSFGHFTQRQIAGIFQVSRGVIKNVLESKTWIA